MLILSISPLQASMAKAMPSNVKMVCMSMEQQQKHCFDTSKRECMTVLSLVSLPSASLTYSELLFQVAVAPYKSVQMKPIYPDLLLRPPIA